MDNIENQRIGQIHAVNLFNQLFQEWNTMLYIGANTSRFHYSDILKLSFLAVDVVEIDPERCAEVKVEYDWLRNIVCGDITEASVNNYDYEIIFWSHGPAVIDNPFKAVETIKKLESHTRELIVLMTPWGHCEQPPHTLDIDRNKIAIPPEVFLSMGYSVNCIGKENERNSNLLAWKFIA